MHNTWASHVEEEGIPYSTTSGKKVVVGDNLEFLIHNMNKNKDFKGNFGIFFDAPLLTVIYLLFFFFSSFVAPL